MSDDAEMFGANKSDTQNLDKVVQAVIEKALDLRSGTVSLNDSLESLGIDSHYLATIIFELEELLGSEFPIEDAASFGEVFTVRDLARAVTTHVRG